jgi:hypothetical protein
MRDEKKVIGLVVTSGKAPDLRLFQWLSGILPVRFENREVGQLDSLDAVIFISDDQNDWNRTANARLPLLLLLNPAGERVEQRQVTFGDSEWVPSVFRSRTIGQDTGTILPFHMEDRLQVLATIANQPVWATRIVEGHRHDIASMSLPQTDPAKGPNDCFLGRNFFRLLPLVDFTRHVSGEAGWSAPPMRACFLFDDPNLHCSSYGWLIYSEIARHASEHNFHVAFATVPLDGWYVSRKSAAFFAGSQARLSLLIHGNDHLFEELSSFIDEDEALSSLAQAWRRVERLERKSLNAISRVIAPPHGTCSELCLRVMARLGFEGVSTTLSWLAVRNAGKPWTQQLGLRPAEVVAGMPVIPRVRLDSQSGNSALLAAYLGQPIILYGHHHDVAGGLGFLDDMADHVNSLGNVQWTNLENISRNNYQTRQRKDLIEIRAYARIIEVTIPPEITMLRLERPWLDNFQVEGLRTWLDGQEKELFPNYGGEPFRVTPGSRLRLESIHPAAINPCAVSAPRNRVQPFLRRVACECRDRLKPAMHLLQKRNVS